MDLGEVTSNRQQAEATHLFKDYYTSVGFDADTAASALLHDIQETNGRIFLAQSGHISQGAISYTHIEPDVAEIRALYVDPTYRKTGIGSELLAAVLEQLRKQHTWTVRLYTLATMTDAISLYSKFGFETTPPYKSGMLDGTVFMRLKLAPQEKDRQP